uniref:Uncharacterized protein n=1 Tax=Zea mays TaxID=4577 RepID=C0PLY9_MAIZE|nr:unknown [Zea mays]ACN36606.1 unknown [Zea mays]
MRIDRQKEQEPTNTRHNKLQQRQAWGTAPLTPGPTTITTRRTLYLAHVTRSPHRTRPRDSHC